MHPWGPRNTVPVHPLGTLFRDTVPGRAEVPGCSPCVWLPPTCATRLHSEQESPGSGEGTNSCEGALPSRDHRPCGLGQRGLGVPLGAPPVSFTPLALARRPISLPTPRSQPSHVPERDNGAISRSSDGRDLVELVLDGELAYDDLDFDIDQARVRQVWDERVAERIAALDFEGEFMTQGRAWTEIEEDGTPIRRDPSSSIAERQGIWG